MRAARLDNLLNNASREHSTQAEAAGISPVQKHFFLVLQRARLTEDKLSCLSSGGKYAKREVLNVNSLSLERNKL